MNYKVGNWYLYKYGANPLDVYAEEEVRKMTAEKLLTLEQAVSHQEFFPTDEPLFRAHPNTGYMENSELLPESRVLLEQVMRNNPCVCNDDRKENTLIRITRFWQDRLLRWGEVLTINIYPDGSIAAYSDGDSFIPAERISDVIYYFLGPNGAEGVKSIEIWKDFSYEYHDFDYIRSENA